jgi:hypothetical protein
MIGQILPNNNENATVIFHLLFAKWTHPKAIFRACLVLEILQKNFKIFRHIKYLDVCIKH